MDKNLSDNGHFVQSLTSLMINSTSIQLTEQCIDFYRKAFDDEDPEVKNTFGIILANQIFWFHLDSYSCSAMS